MHEREKLRNWNRFFNRQLKKGISWHEIRIALVVNHGIKSGLVELLIHNYKKDQARRTKVATGFLVTFILVVLALPLIFQRASVTGMVIVGGNNTDYLEIGNGVNMLFVDINNPNCNDAYSRAQALHGETPWCTLDAPLTNDKLLSGDTLYIGTGEYNGESDLIGWSITNNLTITSYPGDSVNLTRYYEGGQASVPNALWINVSSGGNNVWYTSLSSSSTSHPRVYYQNTTKFFTWTNYVGFIASNYPENSWFNSSSNRLLVKFSDATKNPNNIPIYLVSEYQPLYLQDNVLSSGAYIIIRNITFKFILYGIQLRNQPNVIIENCNIIGGHNGIYVDGRDSISNKNLIIRFNYLNGKQNPVWYGDDMKNEATEETSGIYIEDFAGKVEIYNNTFVYWHGGLVLYADSPYEGNGSEIYNNVFRYGRGSQIEIEDYCSNTKYHHNRVYDNDYAGVSFAPADASSGMCEFYNNEIISASTQRWNSTVSYNNYAVKAQSRVYMNITNWFIHHNTFYGYGRALNTMEMASSGVTLGAWVNTIWKDNIFYAEKEYALLRTGLADDNVFYDYNLYYLKPGGSKLLQRWNNNNLVGHSSLAVAKASSDWDGTWDINSVEADPQFADLANNDLTPQVDSPACTMSSTGSYVGALPCAGSEPEPICGDDSCNGAENCSTCEADCGVCPPPANNPPTQSTPILNASDAPYNTTNATLNCYNRSTADADGDPVINSYRWFRNSTFISALTSNTVNQGNTTTGDRWKCEVTPYDGEDYGTPLNSSELVINAALPICGDDTCNGVENCSTCEADCGACPPPANNPPTHSTPLLNASDRPYNTTDATLNCYNQSTADADGDPVTNNYRWFRDNSLVAGLITSTVNAGNTSTGESWKCEVTLYDGEDYGTAMNSSALTINQLPDTILVRMNSSSGNNYTADDLRCYANVTGFMTGMTAYYNIYNGSTLYASGSRSVTKNTISSIVNVSSSVTNDNESWKCSVKASYDGVINESDWNNASIIIQPTPPAPFCGDSVCNGVENCSSCSSDCGVCTITGCTLDDQAWFEDSSLPDAFNLSGCFNDPLGHSLSFRARGNSSINVSISANGMVNLSSPANWSGEEYVIFNASDGNRSAVTNNITLTVSPVPDCGDSVCESGETCTSCSYDCGACSSSSGGGGGGGGGASQNSTDWVCGEWSECLNGKQNQICTHVSRDAQKTNTRSCTKAASSGTSGVAAPKPKPIDVNKTDTVNVEKKTGVDEGNLSDGNITKEPSEQSPGVVVKETRSNPKYARASGVIALLLLGAFIYGNLKKPRKPIEKTEPQKDYAKELDDYVKTAAKSGYPKSKIKSELIGVGWANDIVEAVLSMNTAEFVPEESEEDGEDDSKSINFLKGEPEKDVIV